MTFVFATNNKFKFHEVKFIISNKIKLISLADLNFFNEIPETQSTIEGNAQQKATYIYNKFGLNCFADDTGLEIDALNGEPGVYSARYAGKNCSFHDNIIKVLQKLKNNTNRKARFRTVISLIEDGKITNFEGIIYGGIINEFRGKEGFGYDPVFLPSGYNKTFAEMTTEEKNKISHRAIAIKKLTDYLNDKY